MPDGEQNPAGAAQGQDGWTVLVRRARMEGEADRE